MLGGLNSDLELQLWQDFVFWPVQYNTRIKPASYNWYQRIFRKGDKKGIFRKGSEGDKDGDLSPHVIMLCLRM